jgi:hypothetical protein
MQALRDNPAARKDQDDGEGQTNRHDEQRPRVVPQIGSGHDRLAVIARWADERMNILLMDVDSCRECAADYHKREFKTVQPANSNTKRHSDRRERAKKRDRVAPRTIGARHDVQTRREVPNEVILQQEYRDKTGHEHCSRR